MNVNILTEEQARSIAIECSTQVLQAMMEKFSISIPNPQPDKDTMFTPKQLAEYWQCHIQTIHSKKLKGELPFFQNGRVVLFSKKAIDKLTTVSLSKK